MTNRFSWSFMQQRIPTGINEIFSCFMGSDANANIIQDFQIYVTCENQCFSFKTEDEKIQKYKRLLRNDRMKRILGCYSKLNP